MWGLRSSRTVVLLAAAATFVIVGVLPLVDMLAAIVRPSTGAAALRAALLDSRQLSLLSTTMIVGLGTATLATLIGAPLGFVLARIALPYKAALRIALAAPAVLPPYVVALALIAAAGSGAFTAGGAIVVLTVVFYPLTMLATEAGVRRVDPRLEDAGLLVATPARVLRRITWPLVLPTVTSAALVIFVLAISEFSVPGLLRVRVFTTEVFTAFAALYDFGLATVLSLPLLIVSIGVGACAAIVLGDRLVTTRRSVGGAPGDAFDAWRPAAAVAVGVVIAAMLIVPVTVLVGEAARSTSISVLIWNSRRAVVNSLTLAMVGATAATLLGACLGYARARATATAGSALDAFWVVLFAVPSTVVGIGLIGTWNRTGVFGVLYGTPAMLVLAYLARLVPVCALAIGATIRTVPESHEEAAATAGAGWMRTMTQIVLPQVRNGLLAAWVVAFILAFGEVGTSILVAPPGESTLPIRVYTLIANAPPGDAAALAVVQTVVILCALALLGIASTHRRPA